MDDLPLSQKGKVITYQLVKAGTSVGANYRAACRGRSAAEYQSKLQTVLEEADESGYWLELILNGHLLSGTVISPVLQEANELTALFNHSLHKFRTRGSKPDSPPEHTDYSDPPHDL